MRPRVSLSSSRLQLSTLSTLLYISRREPRTVYGIVIYSYVYVQEFFRFSALIFPFSCEKQAKEREEPVLCCIMHFSSDFLSGRARGICAAQRNSAFRDGLLNYAGTQIFLSLLNLLQLLCERMGMCSTVQCTCTAPGRTRTHSTAQQECQCIQAYSASRSGTFSEPRQLTNVLYRLDSNRIKFSPFEQLPSLPSPSPPASPIRYSTAQLKRT